MTWCCLMAPIMPTTETKRRKTPLAVIPPMMGRLVMMPETLPGENLVLALRILDTYYGFN